MSESLSPGTNCSAEYSYAVLGSKPPEPNRRTWRFQLGHLALTVGSLEQVWAQASSTKVQHIAHSWCLVMHGQCFQWGWLWRGRWAV